MIFYICVILFELFAVFWAGSLHNQGVFSVKEIVVLEQYPKRNEQSYFILEKQSL